MKRKATAVMICLVALAIASMLFAEQAISLVARQRAARTHLRHLNAQVLASSALDRARVRANLDRNYRGETWEPELAAGEPRRAIITLVSEGDDPQVEIEAILGGEDDHPIRVLLSRPLLNQRAD